MPRLVSRALCLGVASTLLIVAGGAQGGAAGRGRSAGPSLLVRATPVELAAGEPGRQQVGALVFRGGLRLASDDSRFGGWSALHVSADGARLIAVSDEGHWLSARLEHDAQGRLAGLVDAEIGPLLGLDGEPLPDKADQDAESLAVMPDGVVLVGFERKHRIWAYPGPVPFESRPQPFEAPPGLERAPPNLGLESLAALPDGGLLALSEGLFDDAGGLIGWLRRGGRWSRLSYRTRDTARPSDASALPDGDVVVLERSYSETDGMFVRLRRIAARCLAAGAALDPPVVAELRPPLTVDNYEAVSPGVGAGGETLLYILSDDNFNALQKTYLMLFELRGGAAAAGCR